MHYEEQDAGARVFMLAEYHAEQSLPHPYTSKALSPTGLKIFLQAIVEAINNGDNTTLYGSIQDPQCWLPTEEYIASSGEKKERKRNIPQAATRLALTEFST